MCKKDRSLIMFWEYVSLEIKIENWCQKIPYNKLRSQQIKFRNKYSLLITWEKLKLEYLMIHN